MKVKKLVFGVGVNDADYGVTQFESIGYVNGKRKQKLVWECPYYRAWRSMLTRCYSTRYQEKYPTYVGCSVTEEWLTFSVFKNWMMTQDWKDNQLDKDLLVKGNKVYGPETCVFVSPVVNSFTLDRGNDRGEWLIGVNWHKGANKFRSTCSNPLTEKRETLGYFDCEQEAHEAWLMRKRELAHLLAAEQADERVAIALINRYSNFKTNG